MASGNMDEKGLESAAILMMSLGEEQAAEVFKHLAPKEVQRLGETIARMKSVTRERVDEVLEDFVTVAASEHMLVADSNEYVKGVLRKALGDEKANLLIDRILQGSDVTGIESLKWMDPTSVAELLRNEHPQIVAAILVHLEFDQASDVLKLFTERQRNEVMVRIATLDGIQPLALRDLNEVMSKVLAGGDRSRKSSLGGVKTAAEILNMLGSAVETSVLDFVREAAEDHGQHVHLRRRREDRRQGHPGPDEGSAEREPGDRAEGRHAGIARQGLQEHEQPRGRDAEGRPGVARPGAPVRGRGRAEGNAEDRPTSGRRRTDRAGRRR